MGKDEFVNKFLWNQNQNKIRQAIKEDRIINSYSCERIYEQNKGKVKTFKRRGVNSDR